MKAIINRLVDRALVWAIMRPAVRDQLEIRFVNKDDFECDVERAMENVKGEIFRDVYTRTDVDDALDGLELGLDRQEVKKVSMEVFQDNFANDPIVTEQQFERHVERFDELAERVDALESMPLIALGELPNLEDMCVGG